jgi:hypothetical protein
LRRRRERIEQVCWTSSEIRRTLREAGFDKVRGWDATPFFKNDPMSAQAAARFIWHGNLSPSGADSFTFPTDII